MWRCLQVGTWHINVSPKTDVFDLVALWFLIHNYNCLLTSCRVRHRQCITSQRAVMHCGWGVKAGMAQECVAGKTVWDPLADISHICFTDEVLYNKALFKSSSLDCTLVWTLETCPFQQTDIKLRWLVGQLQVGCRNRSVCLSVCLSVSLSVCLMFTSVVCSVCVLQCSFVLLIVWSSFEFLSLW